MKKKSKEELRFIKLGWTILEAKYFYYEKTDSPNRRSDAWYDKIEGEYRMLADKLNLPPAASDGVGFPFDSPSGTLVANRCQVKKFKYTVDI